MKLETKHKEIIWCIILTLGLIIFFAPGCKPKQIIQERIVTKVDSTAVFSLQEENTAKRVVIENLQRELERTREENSQLSSEMSKHEIKYDTSAPLKPDGQYPIASETKTQTKSLLEKEIRENEVLIAEYRKEVNTLSHLNKNLGITIESLKEENRELESKITPTTGFNFRLFFSGVASGIIIMIALVLFIKIK